MSAVNGDQAATTRQRAARMFLAAIAAGLVALGGYCAVDEPAPHSAVVAASWDKPGTKSGEGPNH